MPDELNEVQPGDLITAEFINSLIRRVKALSTGTSGAVQVPNLFARTLSDAVALLSQPGSDLRLGTVLDTAGLVVDTTQDSHRNRLIISQVPSPPMLVPVNTQVHLVLAAAAGGTTPQPTPKPPTITRFDPLSAPIGTELHIIGENFAFSRADNKVTFDGVAAETPSAQSSTLALFVLVPAGIPDAPTQPGQQKTVTVKVTTPQGSASGQVVILPPPPQPLPKIVSFNPRSADLSQSITITGENFGDELAAIKVFFDGNPAGGVAPVATGSSLPTRIALTIPRELPTVVQPGATKSVAITVRVGDRTSPAVPYEISKP